MVIRKLIVDYWDFLIGIGIFPVSFIGVRMLFNNMAYQIISKQIKKERYKNIPLRIDIDILKVMIEDSKYTSFTKKILSMNFILSKCFDKLKKDNKLFYSEITQDYYLKS